MQVVLVSSPETLDQSVGSLKKALGGYDFTRGEKYAEFRPGDHVAEFGLAALIAGGAAAVATKKGFWRFLSDLGRYVEVLGSRRCGAFSLAGCPI